MATQILLPKLGFSMEEGAVLEWFVADGGQAKKGELLYSLEADKTVMEIEAPESGTLRIIGQIGEKYPVGTVIAEIS